MLSVGWVGQAAIPPPPVTLSCGLALVSCKVVNVELPVSEDIRTAT